MKVAFHHKLQIPLFAQKNSYSPVIKKADADSL